MTRLFYLSVFLLLLSCNSADSGKGYSTMLSHCAIPSTVLALDSSSNSAFYALCEPGDSVAELIFYNVKEMDSCISWKEGVIRVPVSCYRSKHGFGHNDSSLRLNRVP